MRSVSRRVKNYPPYLYFTIVRFERLGSRILEQAITVDVDDYCARGERPRHRSAGESNEIAPSQPLPDIGFERLDLAACSRMCARFRVRPDSQA